MLIHSEREGFFFRQFMFSGRGDLVLLFGRGDLVLLFLCRRSLIHIYGSGGVHNFLRYILFVWSMLLLGSPIFSPHSLELFFIRDHDFHLRSHNRPLHVALRRQACCPTLFFIGPGSLSNLITHLRIMSHNACNQHKFRLFFFHKSHVAQTQNHQH